MVNVETLYPIILNQLRVLSMIASIDDIKEIIKEIEKTDALLPFTDPIAYIKVSKNIPGHLEILRKVLVLRIAMEEEIATTASQIITLPK